MGYLFRRYWPVGSDGPQNITAITNTFGYSPELDGKILLMKTPHTWVIGYGDIKLVLNLILHPYWLALIVLEDATNANL